MQEEEQALSILARAMTGTVKELSARLSYDVTFPAVVFQPGGEQHYIIRKDNHCYSVPNALGTVLSPGQKVWVKIPQNNMNAMHICGLRTTEARRNSLD